MSKLASLLPCALLTSLAALTILGSVASAQQPPHHRSG
jgi:hypothetical protein